MWGVSDPADSLGGDVFDAEAGSLTPHLLLHHSVLGAGRAAQNAAR
jgi:hypothetical protein